MSGFRNGKMPIEHIKIKPWNIYFQEEEPIVQKLAIQIAERFDNDIMAKMVEIAREEGFTDLVLIDKEFVVTALKNEMERRKNEES